MLVEYALVLPVDYPVRSLDKAVFVYARICRKRVNKAYVRAFRRLYRAHAAIVRIMNVSHLERRTVSVKAALAERTETPLMCELRKRVRLIHELRKLR